MRAIRTVLGTNEIGGSVDEEACVKALHLFQEYGHNELDSSYAYQDEKTLSLLQKYASKTTKISTKANPWGENTLQPESVRLQLEHSLLAIKRDSVDVFYLHSPDKNTPITDTLREVNQLYKEGKFKEFGISNYKSWQVAQIYEICRSHGWVNPTVYEGVYSAIKRHAEVEIMPCLRHYKIRFYGYSPLASGLLTGKHKFGDINANKEGRFWTAQFNNVYRDFYWKRSYFDALEKLQSEIDSVYTPGQVSLTEASIRWLYHHSMLDGSMGDAVILGFSKLEHLQLNLKFTKKGKLHEKVVLAFEELWSSTMHLSLADKINL